MSLTERLRNIVNPFPEEYRDSTGGSSTSAGGANGAEYEYEDERNLWVIEGIHDSYINFGIFPPIGKRLEAVGPINPANNVIKVSDVMAYAAAFPQNAKVARSVSSIRSEFNPPNDAGLGLALVRISPEDSLRALEMIITRLKESNLLDKFITSSVLESYEESKLIYTNSQTSIPQELTNAALVYRLMEVPFITSTERRMKIRESFSLDSQNTIGTKFLESLTYKKSLPSYGQPSDLSFNDWTENITADKKNTVVYHNAQKRKFFYCVRTNSRDPKAFDLKLSLVNEDSPMAANIARFKRQALRSILLLADKSPKNLTPDLLDSMEVETRYGDSYRPTPPAGLGLWLLSAKIDEGLIQDENLFSNAESGEENFYPSPIRTSQNIMSNLNPVNIVHKSMGQFKEDVRKATYLLDFYSQQMSQQGVSPSDLSGLIMETEIEKLQTFMDDVDNFLSYYRIDSEDDDLIEFRFNEQFQLECVVYNGLFLSSYMGKDITTLVNRRNYSLSEDISGQSQEDITYSHDSFRNQTQTSLGYVFWSSDIAAESDKGIPNRILPWSEFLPLYTYPDPNRASIEPSKLSFKQRYEKTPFGKQGLHTDVTLYDLRNYHKTLREREYVSIGKTKITGGDLYLAVNSSLAGCGTAQAQLLTDAAKLYFAVTGKTSIKDLIAMSVSTIRKNFIANKQAGAFLDDAAKYAASPDLVIKDIEREVNQEFQCLLDILGEATELALSPLKPLGVVKPIRALTVKTLRQGITMTAAGPVDSLSSPAQRVFTGLPPGKKPTGLTIPRKKVSGLMDAYSKALEKMLEQAIKQFILSIFRDVVSSLVGCGPPEKNDVITKDLQNLSSNYGVVRINDIIREAGNINIVEIANNLGIKDRTLDISTEIEGGESDESLVVLREPTIKQLTQMNSDISDVLAQGEAYALLSGYSDGKTLALILEMIYEGEFGLDGIEGTSEYAEKRRKSEAFMRTRQESFQSGDVRYATLDLTPGNITSFYEEIGKKIPDLEKAIADFDPDDAYCNFRDPTNLIPDDLGISQEQLKDQYDQQIEAAREKLDSLCETWNLPFASLNEWITDLSNSLSPPQWYTDLLNFIAKFSNDTLGAALAWILSIQASTPEPRPVENDLNRYELYNTLKAFLPDEHLQPTMTTRTSPANDQALEWYIGDNVIGEITFRYAGEEAIFYYKDPDEPDPAHQYKPLFRVPLSEDNDPCAGGFNTYSIKNKTSPDGTPISSVPIVFGSGGDVSEFALGWYDITLPRRHQSNRWTEKLIYNNHQSILAAMASFFVRELPTNNPPFSARRNFRKYAAAITQPKFSLNGDKCLTPEEEKIAKAAMAGIQSRVINFSLNMGYLFNRYFGWNTPDTLESLSSYLFEKFKVEAIEKDIYGVYLETMPLVAKGYTLSADVPRPGNVVFEMSLSKGLEEGLKYVFKQQILAMIVSIAQADYLRYSPILLNLFRAKKITVGDQNLWVDINPTGDPNSNYTYDEAYFRQAVQDSLDKPLAGHPVAAPTFFEKAIDLNRGDALPEDEGQAMQVINAEYGAFYFPSPLIYAGLAAFSDKIVDVVGRFAPYRFYAGQRVAIADDDLLSAVNGAHIRKFSRPFDDYPVDIGEERYYSPEEIKKAIKVLEEHRERITTLEMIIGRTTYNTQSQEDISYTGILTGVDTNDFSALNEAFQRFFDPIYAGAIPRLYAYLESESVTAEKVAGLNRKFVTKEELYEHNEEGNIVTTTLGDGKFGLSTNGAKAWYERTRQLGTGGKYGADKNLIWAYIDMDDLDERMSKAEQETVILQGPDSTVTTKNYIENARLYTVNENSWEPQTAIREKGSQFLGACLSTLVPGLIMTGATIGVAGVLFLGTVLAFSASIGTGGLAWVGISAGFASACTMASAAGPAFPIALAVILFIMAVKGLGEWDDDAYPDFEDPYDYEQATRALSGDVRSIKLDAPAVQGDRSLTHVRPFDIIPGGFEMDVIQCAQAVPHHRNHGTINKIAINKLYYELAWRSAAHKPRYDGPYSELAELRAHVKLPPEEITVWPKSVSLESVLPPTNLVVIHSPEHAAEVVRELQSNPVFSSKRSVHGLRSGMDSLLQQVDDLIQAAETIADDDDYTTFRSMRDQIKSYTSPSDTGFMPAYQNLEALAFVYETDRASVWTDVILYKEEALAAIFWPMLGVGQEGWDKVASVENKIRLAANLITGGGSVSRSILGSMDDLQDLYEDITGRLLTGQKLRDDGWDYEAYLQKIENDIIAVGAAVATAQAEELGLTPDSNKFPKDRIFGDPDEC